MPTAQSTVSTAHSTNGSTSAVRTPCVSVSSGTVTAASVTPSGCDICRMPIARPRRSFGNHPTTTRPLAAFVDALVMPAARNANPSSSGSPAVTHAATTVSVVSARPPAITTRSPTRSVTAPQAISVRTRPIVGAAANSPADANGIPCASRCGMSSAGADTTRVPAACAATPSASIVHALAGTTAGAAVEVCAGTAVRSGSGWCTRTVYQQPSIRIRLVRAACGRVSREVA